ncbi:MAG: RidA family protein [Acidimicrobiales bacterium]
MPRQSIEIDTFAHVNPIPAASRVGPLVCSSIIPPFNAGERKVPADIQDCIRNIFLHMGKMLEGAGAGWEHVAKITFYVNDIKYREELNAQFVEHFPDAASRPARYTALAPDGPKVSAEFIAYVE